MLYNFANINSSVWVPPRVDLEISMWVQVVDLEGDPCRYQERARKRGCVDEQVTAASI